MSHALVIAALSADQIREHDGIEGAIGFQMEPFNENGEWFSDGSRWDYWGIGGRYSGRLLGKDVCHRRDLTIEAMDAAAESRVREWWPRFQDDLAKHGADSSIVRICWGSTGNVPVSLEDEIAKAKAKRLSAYAFLKDRRWYEGERMGWFGASARTECEIKAADDGLQFEGRCINTCEQTGAKIVTWNEDGEVWGERYFPRFILNLPPDTTLAAVDYHV